MHLEIIVASSSSRSFGETAAVWIERLLRSRPGVSTEILLLRDFPLPAFDHAPPAEAPRAYPDGHVAGLGRALDRADGFVVATPEYNHGYPASLKSALDHTYVEWGRKPVGFVGYGGLGAVRAVEQLRQVVVELEMVSVRTSVHLLPPTVRAATVAEGAARWQAFAEAEPRLGRLVDELLWWAEALAHARSGASRHARSDGDRTAAPPGA